MTTASKIPQHVAIIMDGNGRWARERNLPRVAGHKAGVGAVREVVKACIELGVPILTLYAFSQENWKRPKQEVSLLMNLLDYFLRQEVKNLQKKGVRLQTIGRIEALPTATLTRLREAVQATRQNQRLILILALNYGARTEILDAVGNILKEAAVDTAWMNGSKVLTEELFSNYLYTRGLPDPDLLIRTSGEMRLSNFLLWQLSYAEIYIARKYWPDFKKADLLKAIREYDRRERRFGDVAEAAS